MAVMATPKPPLPVDIYFLVFDVIDDLHVLWSTCRNVSRFWRACVDEYIRLEVFKDTFIELQYSDFHTRTGPLFNLIHVPFQFTTLSHDDTRAIFQQRAYVHDEQDPPAVQGSIRGWIPFIERYCEESQKSKPSIKHARKASSAAPLWEREHAGFRQRLFGDEKKDYLSLLRDMTSLGRGDRPPYFLKVCNIVDDTELVGLKIDCQKRQISFNWRATFALLFRERAFDAHIALEPSRLKDVYDGVSAGPAHRHLLEGYTVSQGLRARRKRIRPWLMKNKRRLSSEVRLRTEQCFELEKERVYDALWRDNLCDVKDKADLTAATIKEEDEIVPAKLARDHPDLLFWPWGDQDGFFLPKERRWCGNPACIVS